jgi:hypothetical protein
MGSQGGGEGEDRLPMEQASYVGIGYVGMRDKLFNISQEH